MQRGLFTISLDFELLWGTLEQYGPAAFAPFVETERDVVVDRLLELFCEFGVRATWCIVGHVMLGSCAARDGVAHPEIVRDGAPTGAETLMHDPCSDEATHPGFYGRSIVERIRSCPVAQEIGCHSFSHVLFTDPCCTRARAQSELSESVRVAADLGIQMRSFVFPRNRVAHLDVLREHGFTCFRGPEPTWYERSRTPPAVKRVGHLFDVLTARRPSSVRPRDVGGLWNVPGSVMYFPAHGLRRNLPIAHRVRRVVKGIDDACANGRLCHLWFHPTNLADEPERMFDGLRRILEHVDRLRSRGELLVAPMGEVPALAGSPS